MLIKCRGCKEGSIRRGGGGTQNTGFWIHSSTHKHWWHKVKATSTDSFLHVSLRLYCLLTVNNWWCKYTNTHRHTELMSTIFHVLGTISKLNYVPLQQWVFRQWGFKWISRIRLLGLVRLFRGDVNGTAKFANSCWCRQCLNAAVTFSIIHEYRCLFTLVHYLKHERETWTWSACFALFIILSSLLTFWLSVEFRLGSLEINNLSAIRLTVTGVILFNI